MGYSHYYRTKKLTHHKTTWDNFLKNVQKLASLFSLKESCNAMDYIVDPPPAVYDTVICGGLGEGAPTFNKDEIRFNGDASEGLDHETLLIMRKVEMSDWEKENYRKRKEHFSFCKTARKPYDLLVMGVLILYKHHFKDQVRISSDGGPEEWADGFDLVKTHLRLNLKYKDFMGD